jgi:hypothetical protein
MNAPDYRMNAAQWSQIEMKDIAHIHGNKFKIDPGIRIQSITNAALISIAPERSHE